MPDFAGVALVDILANGVAMLIIVIVLSIAARVEREERYVEQVEEVSTVMSRRFSTSLVLNRLAASLPAQLHDYENSPLDQVFDPALLPILELHSDYVREFYTGYIWTRPALLRDPNTMDDWLEAMSPLTRQRLRVDVYDIGQFYLVISILRDHGVRPAHWHFLPGRLELAHAGRCPPGVSAGDCLEAGVARDADAPALPDFIARGGGGEGLPGPGEGGGGAGGWPPEGLAGAGGEGQGLGGALAGGGGNSNFPAGASLSGSGGGVGEFPGSGGGMGGGTRGGGPGGGAGGLPGSGGMGGGMGGGQGGGSASFPSARSGQGSGRGGLFGPGGGWEQGVGGGLRMRIASPDSLDPENAMPLPMDLGSEAGAAGALTAFLRFAGELQARYDAGASPSADIQNFRRRIVELLRAPPELSEEEFRIVRELAYDIAAFGAMPFDGENPKLAIYHEAGEPGADTALAIHPNRLLVEASLLTAPEAGEGLLPQEARPVLSLNSHPGIWRGLQVTLDWDSILLLPPAQQKPGQVRWRAVVYIAPELDDFIVGFVLASLDDAGRLHIQGEANRARLAGRVLASPYVAPVFGTRGWLLLLYGALGLCGITALLFGAGRPRR